MKNKNADAAQPKAAHTPGPWRLDFEKHYSGAEGFSTAKNKVQSLAIYGGRKCLCAVISAWRAPDPQSLADARLIAAAPETAAERDRLKAVNAELLAALQAMTEELAALAESGYAYPHLIARARAAIAKAQA